MDLSEWILYNWSRDEAKQKEYIEAIAKLMEEKVIVPFEGKTYNLVDFKVVIIETKEVARSGKELLTRFLDF